MIQIYADNIVLLSKVRVCLHKIIIDYLLSPLVYAIILIHIRPIFLLFCLCDVYFEYTQCY